LGQVIVL